MKMIPRISRRSLVALVLACVTSTALSARLQRLSAWIHDHEIAAAGFEELSDEQVASIDALAARKVLAKKGGKALGFSESLTDSEHAACGLQALDPAERAHLDALIAQWRETAPQIKDSPSPFALRLSDEVPLEHEHLRPKVGGSVSVTYGVAEGGGTLRSGSAYVTYDDPARGFSAAVGYSRTEADGAFVRPRYILLPESQRRP